MSGGLIRAGGIFQKKMSGGACSGPKSAIEELENFANALLEPLGVLTYFSHSGTGTYLSNFYEKTFIRN